MVGEVDRVFLRTLLMFFLSFVRKLPGTLKQPLKVGFGFGVVCMVGGFF